MELNTIKAEDVVRYTADGPNFPKTPSGEEVPEWVRSFMIHKDLQIVFVPCVFADELSTTLVASFDRVPVVTWEDHQYFPAEWVKENYKDEYVQDFVGHVVEAAMRVQLAGK